MLFHTTTQYMVLLQNFYNYLNDINGWKQIILLQPAVPDVKDSMPSNVCGMRAAGEICPNTLELVERFDSGRLFNIYLQGLNLLAAFFSLLWLENSCQSKIHFPLKYFLGI